MNELTNKSLTGYEAMCHGISLRFGKDMGSFRRKENSSASKDLKNALMFTSATLEPYEVALTAYILTFATFVAMILVDAILFILVPMDFLSIVFYILIPTACLPLAVLSLVASYPKMQARRLRNKALGRLPEAINYLVMSMKLSPSLDRAIDFAAENLDEPVASAMKRILWNVYMRKHHSIEESFVSFSYEWGDWNEDFKRALYAIRAAELERTQEGLNRGLEKASDIILTGTKQTMETYTAKLSGPTFILFAMGILLPMILGSMLPMMSVGGMSIGAAQLVLLMDVAIPLVSFGYAYSILGNRPGTTPPPHLVESPGTKNRYPLLGAIIIAALLVPLALPPVATIFGWGYLPILWAIGGAVSFHTFLSARDLKRRGDKIKKLEDELPDALFQLGSRISEGKAIEAALEKTSETMKGTLIAALFHRMARVLQMTRTSLDEALFGKSGILNDHPSRILKASMKTVVEVVKKDAVTAGQTIVGLSNHLRDMRKVEHEIRTKLSQVMGMMTSTALIFAPVVLGVTSALYFVMAHVMEGLKGISGAGFSFGGGPIVPFQTFTLVLGVYLFLTVLIITYFVSGMKEGDDPVDMRYQIGRTMPVALLIYSVASMVGGMMVV
jgi:Flp pilus assembly protein TadB